MKYKIGDYVRKTKGSHWEGVIVGTYRTVITPCGYCIESISHHGAVQIYPEAALELLGKVSGE
jgi:dihydrofolate reductase (trimethoprim resistance protein)